MATIRKRNGKWQAQVRIKGSGALSRTFLTKADAQAWSRSLEAEAVRRGLPVGLKVLDSMTVSHILIRYRDEVTPNKRGAVREYVAIRVMLRSDISKTKLSSLSAAVVNKYIKNRLATVKPGTVRRELSILQHALEVSRNEWELPLQSNPVAMSKKPQAAESRTRRLEAGEWECLRNECAQSGNAQLLPMVELGIETAMRRGEVLSLQWKDIDWNKKTLLIHITKNGHARTIPLTPRALQIIEAQRSIKHHSDSRIFPTTEAAIKMAWRRVIRRCCLIDFKYHDLRHEAISRFFELGLSIPEVALISGHRDTKMLMRYTHIRPENVSQKLLRLTEAAAIVLSSNRE